MRLAMILMAGAKSDLYPWRNLRRERPGRGGAARHQPRTLPAEAVAGAPRSALVHAEPMRTREHGEPVPLCEENAGIRQSRLPQSGKVAVRARACDESARSGREEMRGPRGARCPVRRDSSRPSLSYATGLCRVAAKSL